MPYQHTQIGYLMIVALGVPLLIAFFILSTNGFNKGLLFLFLILLFCLILFPSLKIEIDETKMNIKFGLGIINKKFILKEIQFCRIVKNPWYYGWGIHLTPYGWLFNVSGFSAVEIQMENGKKYRIGTDEPVKLEQAINSSTLRGR